MELMTFFLLLVTIAAIACTIHTILSMNRKELALRMELRDKHSEFITTMDKLMEMRVDKEQLSTSAKQLIDELETTKQLYKEELDKNIIVLSQKKSSEVRLGQISEHIVPFLENCKYDPKTMHFMGNPIDYVVFDFDSGKIIFLEVKSGNSKPNKRQKILKNVIRAGRVFYEEIRINEKGVKTKRAENLK